MVVWICRDCALEEAREQRFGEDADVAVRRNYRQPLYIFYDADDYRWTSGTPRELAEARGTSLEDRYAVRLVTAPVGGTVRGVDEEALVRLEDDTGVIHEITGLIATHMRVGERMYPGDCVGIGER